MIENELQDRMRAAVADEPPLGFDPDELVDRAGRQRRRRRSTFAAAGATGAVVVAAVLVTGMPSQRTEVGTTATTAPTVTTTTTTTTPVCAGVEQGTIPPPHFPGSAAIVARLDDAGPRVIAKHLPGVSVQPSDTGMIAYDCPPNVGAVYPVHGVDQRVSLQLLHATDTLDLAHDQYADDQNYRLVGADTAADGALIRTYEQTGDGGMLAVVRFGTDGMITEATLYGQEPFVADRAALTALASDPELRF